MQTYCPEKPMVANAEFGVHKAAALDSLRKARIDEPIQELVHDLANLDFCFTLQSCWGHFVSSSLPDPQAIRTLRADSLENRYHYKIAYLALCLDNRPRGREFLVRLREIPAAVDPKYVQFGCADWFWKQQVNSYVLQVQPLDNAHVDSMDVNGELALELQGARDVFFRRVREAADEFQGRVA